MTGHRSLRIKIRIPNAFSPSIALFTILIALAASAQQADTGRSPATSSAALFDAGNPLFLPAVNYNSGGIFATQVAIADVNGDGKPDLIVGNGYDGSIPGNGGVGVLLGNGDGTFQPVVTHDTGGAGSFANGVVVTDVNGDGKLDLVVANSCGDSYCLTGSTVAVLLGNGDGTFQPPVSYSPGGAALSLEVADVNDDGKLDIVVANPDGFVGVLLGNGDGTFQPAQTYASGGTGSYSVAVLDVNSDGKLDVVVSDLCFTGDCSIPGGVSVLLGNGDGTFKPAVTYPSQGFAIFVAAADFNDDGKPDLAVTNEGSPGAIAVLLGNGDGTFQSAVTYSAGAGPSAVAIADVNGDGNLDLVVALESGPNSYNPGTGAAGVLLGNGNGTFQSMEAFGTQAYVSEFVAVADVNGDGRPDALVVNSWGSSPNGGAAPGSVSVLLNNPQSPTTTTLVSSPNPSLVRQAVIFTATVSSKAGTPPNGETVTFYSGSVLGTAPLRGGKASLTTSSFLQGGTFTITAVYAGDSNFAASTSAGVQQGVINPARFATSTAMSSNLNPSVYGQAITFTVSVASTSGPPPNFETVTFYDGQNIIGTSYLTGGIASLSTPSLKAGIHTVSAAYLGDANFDASTSSALEQVVDILSQSLTTTTLASSLNPSIYGQKVTWTATVTTSGKTQPTGRVNFNCGSDTIGYAALNASGVATLTRPKLNAGPCPLIAVYTGDANNGPSVSPILNQVVQQTTSAATISSSLNPSTHGQAVTFTARITSPTAAPTGPMTFTAGKTVLGTVELSNGKAAFTTSTLAIGSTTVTVTYPWNSDISGSSASVTQNVQ